MATFKEGVLSVRIAKMSPEVEVAHKIKISKG
jgi:HSP20 family molecular chaperone IbpA